MDATNTTTDNTVTPQQTPAPTSTETVNSGSSQSAIAQEEANKLIGKARTEGKAAAVSDILKSLGVASLDELKALKTEAESLKTAKMTESEKLQKERDDAKKEKDEIFAQLQAERAERRNDRIQSELRAALSTAKANNPKTALSYILVNHREAMDALITDDGKVDDKALLALIETVKKEDATLFTSVMGGAGSPSNMGGRTLDTTSEADKRRASQTNQRIIRGR